MSEIGRFRPARRHVLLFAVLVLLGAAAVGVVLLTRTSGVRIVESSLDDIVGQAPITQPIRLTFSQPMDRASVESAFRIEPQVEGGLVWQGQELIFQPHSALAPDTDYTVSLEAGASSEGGRSLSRAYKWRFRTRSPQVLFLGREEPGVDIRQLYAAMPGGGEPVALTNYPLGVWDFTPHPQGEAIVYSVLREDGGSDLWRMGRDGSDQKLQLACPEAACLNPAWSPDGQRLAYERRDIWADAPNLDPKAGRIWLLDLEDGEERPLFDYDVPLHSPVWSPQGNRLAYLSPEIPGIEVYDLDNEGLSQFGNEWGVPPSWSPDGAHLAAAELVLTEEEVLVVRLVRLDLDHEEMFDISGGGEEDLALIKDRSPSWSPGGGWIAFGRQFLDEARWTPGRQIWLTRPDASEAYPLLEEPMADLFAYAWRPDGAALAYLQIDLTEGVQATPDLSLWVFDLVVREPVFVAEDGIVPGWLP